MTNAKKINRGSKIIGNVHNVTDVFEKCRCRSEILIYASALYIARIHTHVYYIYIIYCGLPAISLECGMHRYISWLSKVFLNIVVFVGVKTLRSGT